LLRRSSSRLSQVSVCALHSATRTTARAGTVDQQRPVVGVAALADSDQRLLAPARVLPGDEPELPTSLPNSGRCRRPLSPSDTVPGSRRTAASGRA
jgi:hypothetical protein